MLGTICFDLLTTFYQLHKIPLTIVETGTAFQNFLEPGEIDFRERSTVAIAKWIAANGQHTFCSIDASHDHIVTCQEMLGDYKHLVEFRCGRASLMLSTLSSPFHFVLLDADSDARSTLEEFRIVEYKLAPTSVVVIDDAYKPPSLNKARLVTPYAKSLGFQVWNLHQQAVAISSTFAINQALARKFNYV